MVKSELKAEGWIPVKELPQRPMKVRYRMRKHKWSRQYFEDVGFFSDGQFYTNDPIALLPITDWKPFEPNFWTSRSKDNSFNPKNLQHKHKVKKGV